MQDDLNRPLGLEREPASRFGRPVAWLPLAFGGLGLIAVSLIAFIIITGDRNGGEPFAVARIEQETPPAPAVAAKSATPEQATGSTAAAAGNSAATEMERSSGVKVTRPFGADAPNALVIRVPDPNTLRLAPAPDPRLVEKSRYGMLPRVGADGARPADVYARPVPSSSKLKAGAPRIAIFIGGMGLSRTATQEAIDKLPGAITLAFAPYGSDVEAQAARARESGHEILLQLPMDTFNADDADPGPHTLHSDRSPEAIVDDLHWLMARFPGYVGMTNFLGARFTADEAALAPVLRETRERGLLYIDDATSPRSIADTIASRAELSFARADVVLDSDKTPASIDAALARLETLARKNRVAIGWATGLPGSFDRIAGFARSLEDRGIALVPISAVASLKSRPSADARER
ncbi:MAG: divergent polysaccharide deacetylase family protein [Methylobacteriaceae bacterium]|nr:divergent polysaccharide deacetylase family protein [Methylobacteriaceae bacterium]